MTKNLYSKEELNQIESWLLAGLSCQKIGRIIGKSESAINQLRYKRFPHVPRLQSRFNWSDENLAIAQKLLDSQGVSAVMNHFSISRDSIRGQVKRGNLRQDKDPRIPWSDKDVEFLIEKCGVWSLPRIAKKLKRSVYATSRKLSDLRKEHQVGSGRTELGDWSANAVGRILGVDHIVILRAIRRRDLIARRYSHHYSVSPSALLQFLEKAKTTLNYSQLKNIPQDTIDWITECRDAAYWGNRETH
jgi:hypothetical protein